MRLTIQDRFVILTHLMPKKGDWLTMQVSKNIEAKLKFTTEELQILLKLE